MGYPHNPTSLQQIFSKGSAFLTPLFRGKFIKLFLGIAMVILLFFGLSLAPIPSVQSQTPSLAGDVVVGGDGTYRWVLHVDQSESGELTIAPNNEGEWDWKRGTRFSRDGSIQVPRNINIGSSRTVKENIVPLSTEESQKTLAELHPVKYNYRVDDSQSLTLGFIAEDTPNLLVTSDRQAVKTMDITAILVQIVKEQQQTLLGLEKEIQSLKKVVGKEKQE